MTFKARICRAAIDSQMHRIAAMVLHLHIDYVFLYAIIYFNKFFYTCIGNLTGIIYNYSHLNLATYAWVSYIWFYFRANHYHLLETICLILIDGYKNMHRVMNVSRGCITETLYGTGLIFYLPFVD